MRIAVLPISILISTQLAMAGGQKKPNVVRLVNGVNRITLPDAGAECIAVFVHRDNFNAHGFDIFTLQIKGQRGGTESSEWTAVTFFDGEKEKLNLTVGGGADCLLHDFRLITSQDGSPTTLVLADRDAGETFVDAEWVTFTFFELRKNREGEMGRPLYFFEKIRSERAKKKYCDVGEAFKTELGLADYRQ